MGGADALLWTIDRDPVLRSTIVAVLLLDTDPAPEELRRLFGDLLDVVPRLRWRGAAPVLPGGRARWTVDDRFDLDQHLQRVVAPSPGSLGQVLQLAQAMAGRAFDRELPLWEALVVEGLEHGRAAIVLKIHHALVDGIGGLAALLAVTEGAAAGHDGRAHHPSGTARPAEPEADEALSGTLPVRWLSAAAKLAADPRRAVEGAAHDLVTAARLVAPAPFPRSPLARGRGVLRRFGVFDVQLADLHHTGELLRATLNDVFVAAVLGGLERYHELHGKPVEELRGLIPVSIRRAGDPIGTNRFVPARFLLPAGTADPRARVRRVHAVLGVPVHDPALRVSDTLAALLSRLPPALATAAFGSMLKGSDFVATNVPGPSAEVHVAGARLERIYAFSPPAGAALNVSLVSVGRRACVGVNVDVAAVPDDTLLLECLRASFDELVRLGRPAPAANT